jgi:mono/diheme cytochrome c family protein
MQRRAVYFLAIFAIFCLGAAACRGTGGGDAPRQAADQQQPSTSPGYTMGPGMMGGYGAMGPGRQRNFGMMSQNLNQMNQMMGQGDMSPENYHGMMGMMGQMGGMMHEMGGPNYTPEMEQRHRQQLQGMQQGLNAMQKEGTAPAEASRLGERTFSNRCSGCHPQGGNAIVPDLPIQGSSALADFDTFLAFVRHPRMPDGSRGPMPAFYPDRLSNQQARELYQFLRQQFGQK